MNGSKSRKQIKFVPYLNGVDSFVTSAEGLDKKYDRDAPEFFTGLVITKKPVKLIRLGIEFFRTRSINSKFIELKKPA